MASRIALGHVHTALLVLRPFEVCAASVGSGARRKVSTPPVAYLELPGSKYVSEISVTKIYVNVYAVLPGSFSLLLLLERPMHCIAVSTLGSDIWCAPVIVSCVWFYTGFVRLVRPTPPHTFHGRYK